MIATYTENMGSIEVMNGLMHRLTEEMIREVSVGNELVDQNLFSLLFTESTEVH